MMFRRISGAVSAAVLSVSLSAGMTATAAFAACDALPGNAILDDSFADELWGWDVLAPRVYVQPPQLVLDPAAEGKTNISVLVNTFFAEQGTFCADMTMPATPAGNRIATGVIFWAKDYSNFSLFQIDSNGGASLWRLTEGGGWTSLVPITETPLINRSPGAVNEVRVDVADTLITLTINGSEFRKLRAQRPGTDTKFGAYAQVDAPVATPVNVAVSRYRVIAP